MIAPSVVKFEPDHFICGNTFRCVWALREYPTQTDEQAILRHLGEKDGITLRIYTRQVTPAEEKRIIQNAANKNRMSSSNTNDLQQTITAESNLQDMNLHHPGTCQGQARGVPRHPQQAPSKHHQEA